MSLRIFSAVSAAALLSGCGTQASPEPEGDAIDCAIGQGVEMSQVCTLEHSIGADADFFILHHPDGGFRRIEFDPETRELGVADGADTLRISDQSGEDVIEFSIGQDQYRVPADMLRASAE